ncbi:MAG TPA: hypothetical protein PKV86_09855, partial [Syntrophobacteraceae bacterium]|nr:hypothetical protein [Syntrophobacteraceae bacterium]
MEERKGRKVPIKYFRYGGTHDRDTIKKPSWPGYSNQCAISSWPVAGKRIEKGRRRKVDEK